MYGEAMSAATATRTQVPAPRTPSEGTQPERMDPVAAYRARHPKDGLWPDRRTEGLYVGPPSTFS